MVADTGTSSGTALPSDEAVAGGEEDAAEEPSNLLISPDFFTKAPGGPAGSG